MAHFRAVMQGQRGAASRLGSKASGIWAKVQSWGHDVTVGAWYSEEDNTDYATVTIRRHDGSNNPEQLLLINLTTGKVVENA